MISPVGADIDPDHRRAGNDHRRSVGRADGVTDVDRRAGAGSDVDPRVGALTEAPGSVVTVTAHKDEARMAVPSALKIPLVAVMLMSTQPVRRRPCRRNRAR